MGWDAGWGLTHYGWPLGAWPDGSWRDSSLAEAATPRCTVTADCQGTMVPMNDKLQCSKCGGEIPIEPDKSSEEG